jgi:hypothetical protein
MPLSYSEKTKLNCPACGKGFAAEVWTLVDAAERPDLAEALRAGELNLVGCPHCGDRSPAVAPLLFHDGASRRVYFAAPPEAAEYVLREQAQSLFYRLMAGIPEEGHHPYLGDVQVEQGIEGVRRAMLRRQRARARLAAESPQAAPPPPTRVVEQQVADVGDEPAPILDALQALIAADSLAEFAAIVDEHPDLLGASADAALVQMIDAALAQGEPTLAPALREVRAQLSRMRAGAKGVQGKGVHGRGVHGRGVQGRGVQLNAPTDLIETSAVVGVAEPGILSDVAYQVLLTVASVDELRAALSEHPALLEEWADNDLLLRVESALDAGDERLAAEIEERREALAELREELGGAAALSRAITALLAADGEDELAETLGEHPVLLTGAAQDVLARMVADAQARDDDELAADAEQRRTMLHSVRVGLDAA